MKPAEPAPDGDLADVKRIISTTIALWQDRLVALSRAIHADPELAFDEHRAAARVAEAARAAGMNTEIGVYGLDTAIEATCGTGDLTVTVCAEYDALPDIGHACGHNVIAAAGLGAAIALGAVADRLGIRVKLLGTPAEERGAGKVLMLRAGAWEDSTLSLMVHGAPGIDVSCADLSTAAVDRFDVSFHGRASHAAADSAESANAGSAATIAQVAIGLLRQHLPDGVRVNAYVADGGSATNVIPAESSVRVEVRSRDLDEVRDVKRRLLACFAAGALATGCGWDWSSAEPLYANVVQEPVLATAWDRNVSALGRNVVRWEGFRGGSTDMGNVSQVVPAIHPLIAVLGATGMPHTERFAVDAATPAADRAVIDGATALAHTVADVVADPDSRADLLARQADRAPGATRRS